MARNHDENEDVKLLSRVCKINLSNKTIRIAPNQIIGNRRWGRIDFLTHYCGFTLVRENDVIVNTSPKTTSPEDSDTKRKKKGNKVRKMK